MLQHTHARMHACTYAFALTAAATVVCLCVCVGAGLPWLLEGYAGCCQDNGVPSSNEWKRKA